jgi:hypothetical protein
MHRLRCYLQQFLYPILQSQHVDELLDVVAEIYLPECVQVHEVHELLEALLLLVD